MVPAVGLQTVQLHVLGQNKLMRFNKYYLKH